MANKNIIRVSEFEKLYYDDTKPFKQKHWEVLCRYQEEQNKKREGRIEYYRILNKGIQFTNFVGVIQAGKLTVEILPKTDRHQTTAANITAEELAIADKASSNSKKDWHAVLLQMLRECRLLKINQVNYASLRLKSNSILDSYIELFLSETEKLLHEGLVKKYRKTEGNSLAMKGQLLFAKNINSNLVHKERFYVRYTEYNRINVFNQLLYKTLCIIPSISSNPWLADRVNRLLLDFPEMPDCKVSATTFEKLVFDRKTERYKEALLISKMLLLNFRPDITGGTENVIAILFDMNKLWEEFVYRRLKKEEINYGITVQRQQSANFWQPALFGRVKTIRPDIVIKTGSEIIIIDTKWKIVEDLKPSDEDLKQMFVYNLFWTCERSILLYPSSKRASNHGKYFDFKETKKYFTECIVETINILDENSALDRALGRKIVDMALC
ncbi:MAG: restriction endonuclease [Bacteroidota bacterium]